ncbi:hypothetical protein MHPYR_310084 [uncultured Mycobacterium sp.]|uniref:Uncharacterized protein n=1 Tax=uncultured Mycobacterium sp. TaxID=171292 RepID=A0A1Y5PG41_9MYCO|nr:hypothetical protein MHPYR_310084 [uncultured Mycobacterium sp.]
MACPLNTIRLTCHRLVTFVRFHNRLVHVLKPLVMLVDHSSSINSPPGGPRDLRSCQTEARAGRVGSGLSDGRANGGQGNQSSECLDPTSVTQRPNGWFGQ